MVGRVWPRHRHRGRPLNSVVMRHRSALIHRLWPFIGLAPLSAHADAMIPYMVVPWGQVFLLPLVVIVEAAIIRGFLGGGVIAVTLQSLVANVASTIVGALIYISGMSLIGDPLFTWWFKGGLGTEAIRAALISLSFAAALWAISWAVESLVISRMRKTALSVVAKPCAIANAATYVLLLALALWFGK
jgi:hypothetical protein